MALAKEITNGIIAEEDIIEETETLLSEFHKDKVPKDIVELREKTAIQLKRILESFKTGYEIKIMNKSITYIKHKEKIVYIGENHHLVYDTIMAQKHIHHKVFSVIAEIAINKENPILANQLFQLKNNWEVAKEIEHIIDQIDYQHWLPQEVIEKQKNRFMRYAVSLDYEEQKQREKLKELYDIDGLCRIATEVIRKNNKECNIEFYYKVIKDEDGYVLGSYGTTFKSKKKEETENAVQNETQKEEFEWEDVEKICLYIGNILFQYEQGKHPYQSPEEYTEAISIHETGHMDPVGRNYEEGWRMYHGLIKEAIRNGDESLFHESWIKYVWHLYREEKRAWNQGKKYYISSMHQERTNIYKMYHLRGYLPVLRNRKERWLKQLKENQK